MGTVTTPPHPASPSPETARPGGLAHATLGGGLAGMLLGVGDAASVLRATGTYWFGLGDLVATLALYAVLGAGAAACLALALWPLGRGGHPLRRAASGTERAQLIPALVLFGGVCLGGGYHLFDAGLPLETRTAPGPYLFCVLGALALGVLFGAGLRWRGPRGGGAWCTTFAAFLLAGLTVWVVHMRGERWDDAGTGREEGRPSMVLLVMDTTRRDGLSAYGNPRQTTPNLDRVAEEGVLLTRAYATAPWTPPSHASLFTGVYPSSHGTFRNQVHLRSTLPTLAELLGKRGYRTFFVSAKNLLTRRAGWTRGFDEAVVANLEDRVDPVLWRWYQELVSKTSNTRMLVSLSLRLMERAAQDDRPFFLFLNLNDPHSPYDGREPYLSRFTADLDLSRVDLAKVRRVVQSQHGLIQAAVGRIELNDAEHAMVRALYDSEVASMDAEIGRLYEGLRALTAQRPVVALATADHGEMLGEHQLMGHGPFLFEELIHVPMVLWSQPPVAQGVDARVISNVDVMPTFLELAGQDLRRVRHLEGRSLLAEGPRPPVFAESWMRPLFDGIHADADRVSKVALDDAGHKLIWAYPTSPRLYVLREDPRELYDRAREQPELVEQLLEQLASAMDLKAAVEAAQVDDLDRETRRRLESVGDL